MKNSKLMTLVSHDYNFSFKNAIDIFVTYFAANSFSGFSLDQISKEIRRVESRIIEQFDVELAEMLIKLFYVQNVLDHLTEVIEFSKEVNKEIIDDVIISEIICDSKSARLKLMQQIDKVYVQITFKLKISILI